MPQLSIIIPVLNDQEEINKTISSIRETTHATLEIIVIDDNSDIPIVLLDKHAILIRNSTRVGAGSSRHIGVLRASSKYILMIDSHMRFVDGWYEKAMEHLKTGENTVWCCQCLGLDESMMNPLTPKGIYTGADLVIYRKSDNKLFEGVWRGQQSGNRYDIPCIMGACYFSTREWFLYIGGLEFNKDWGDEEPFLSIKSWLAGGNVMMMNDFGIGHKFRSTSSYTTNISSLKYNKIRPIMTMFPIDLVEKLIEKIPNDINKQSALDLINADIDSINTESEYYKSIFKHDIYWLIEKFKIPCEV